MEERKSAMPKKPAPSSITVNVRQRMAVEERQVQRRGEVPKGLLVGLIAVGSLLVVGVIVVGVLLITQPNAAAAVDTVPTASQTAMPEATPSQTIQPTATPEPIPTTAPENSDDLSSIFEAPTNPILDSQNQ